MLLASNRGAGMNVGMPDVCLTPAAPSPIPVPYPNFAMNMQASPFCTLVRLTGMNALNLGSKIPMTMGDEAGTAHPMFKQMGQYTAGNTVVFLEKLPAINLTCPSTGNNMNAVPGAVLVPSVTNVFFTLDRTSATEELEDVVTSRDEDVVVAERTAEDEVTVKIARFTSDIARAFLIATERAELRAGEFLVVDLRGCPGGDAAAALELAGDFAERGTVLARFVESDGDETRIRARGDKRYDNTVCILVDGKTASAAELFAGVLSTSCDAAVLGETTYGKGTAQRLLPAEGNGPVRYETVGEYLLADGTRIHGAGVVPD